MESETNDGPDGIGPVSRLRNAIDPNLVAMVLVGLLAGYSLSILGTDVVSLPVIGALPGVLVGAVGLSVATGGYLKFSCCGDCGSKTAGLPGGCGCSDDCGDSCSYDP